MKNDSLSRFYKDLPTTPGVYFFKKDNLILYIGKAVNLRNRVKSYFVNSYHDNRIKELLVNANKVDYLEVLTELEALLLEAKLIKQYQPKYNVKLRDDKRYIYVGISNEEYPKIDLIRQPERTENLLDWFGPFPSSTSIKEILRYLRNIFPYFTTDKSRSKLYLHLGLTPDLSKTTSEQYRKTIDKIRMFLDGNISPLVKKLEKEMKETSRKQKYEEAQLIKNQIEQIRYLLVHHVSASGNENDFKRLDQLREIIVKYQGIDPVTINRLEGYDISNLGRNIVVGSMVVFTNGESDNQQYRQFRVLETKGDTEGINQVLIRRLKHQEWLFPQVIMVDGGKGQISAAFNALVDSNFAGKIGLVGLTKEDETIIVPKIEKDKIISWKSLKYTRDNSALQLLQAIRDESHRFAQRYYKKLHKKILFIF